MHAIYMCDENILHSFRLMSSKANPAAKINEKYTYNIIFQTSSKVSAFLCLLGLTNTYYILESLQMALLLSACCIYIHFQKGHWQKAVNEWKVK